MSESLAGINMHYPKDALAVIAVNVDGSPDFPKYHYAGQWQRSIVEDDGSGMPQFVGAEQFEIMDFAVSDGLAVYAMEGESDDTRGLRIEEISDPTSPTVLSITNNSNPAAGSANSFYDAQAVDVQNGRVYLAAGVDLYLFDVSEPSNPICLDLERYLASGSHSTYVLADEPAVYLTTNLTGNDLSGQHGLAIVDVYGVEPILLGDLDGNSMVDEQDRAMLCAALGSSTGESGYIESADLNDDGTIDHLDQQLFNDILPPCGGDMVASATFEPPADGVTNAADLAFLLGAWGNSASCADFVASRSFAPPPDGKVDGADLAYLLGAWGRCN